MSETNQNNNEDDAPQIASEDESLRKFEEELLQSSITSTGTSNDPQKSLTEAVEKLQLNKRDRLSGAARKRLKWLI